MALSQSPLGPYTCAPEAFTYPVLPDTQILSLTAQPVSNFSFWAYDGFWFNHESLNVTGLNFCNVTVSYTHPGKGDNISVQAWLPTTTWNDRLQAVGGGGWRTGLFILADIAMAGAVSEGYATVSTDGGHSSELAPSEWALRNDGTVDRNALENFASVSMNEMTLMGKNITETYYGRPAKYSYFSGCSQGGRQGYMIAQRYPKLFDGIVASAPSINYTYVLMSDMWPQAVMNDMRQYPRACEMRAITEAAIAACDGDDGLVDGLLADPDACRFDPFPLINRTTYCDETETNVTISAAAVLVADAAWTGPRGADGSVLGFGVNRDARLAGWLSIANTVCPKNGTGACTRGDPLEYTADWIKVWLERNTTFDLSSVTRKNFERMLGDSVKEFNSVIGTDNCDLAEFRKAGGKLLTYHGLVSL